MSITEAGWIAYVGGFPFPDKSAASRRVYGVACAALAAGFDVIVGCAGPAQHRPQVLRQAHGKQLSFATLESTHRGLSRLRRVAGWLMSQGSSTVAWLDAQPVRPSHVIYYGDNAGFLLRLMSWCRRNHVPLITDVVEWYDPRHIAYGRYLSPLNLSAKLCLALSARCDGVIAISSFLADHYARRGMRVVRVPTLLDLDSLPAPRLAVDRADHTLRLAYAGSPAKGHKDLIGTVCGTVVRLAENGHRVVLSVAGVTADELLALPVFRETSVRVLPSCIVARGWLPADEALQLVAAADFMPLLRTRERSSMAGFPTKVPESLAVGTPIICNLTSDLGEYLTHGEEALICEDETEASFLAAVQSALALSPQRMAEMRASARRRAEESFQYTRHVDPIQQFLAATRVERQEQSAALTGAAIRS